MFDVGFWELGLIMLIALLVVGPERLPGLARTVGAWVGKMRRMVSEVKAEVDRELRANALRESLGPNAIEDLREAAREVKKVGEELRADVQSTRGLAGGADHVSTSASSDRVSKQDHASQRRLGAKDNEKREAKAEQRALHPADTGTDQASGRSTADLTTDATQDDHDSAKSTAHR